MKILVCIKQVPDPEAEPIVNLEKVWVSYDKKTSYWINRYDEHAVEEALQIKEIIPDTVIDILSIGPERVKSSIKRCIEMGADRGFHINYDNRAYLSPAVKSQLIAKFCAGQEYDLILTGVMSEDMMSAQTGPMIAARLNIPSATSVMKLNVDKHVQNIMLERELDLGLKCQMTLSLPALATIQSGINRPRYPSCSNIMRAKQIEIVEIKTTELENKYEMIAEIIEAEDERTGIRLEGSMAEKATALWQLLHEKSLI